MLIAKPTKAQCLRIFGFRAACIIMRGGKALKWPLKYCLNKFRRRFEGVSKTFERPFKAFELPLNAFKRPPKGFKKDFERPLKGFKQLLR